MLQNRSPSLLRALQSPQISTAASSGIVRVKDGVAEWVDVKTGLASGALVEVFGDLKPGDEIASRGTDELKAGASVQIKPAKPA